MKLNAFLDTYYLNSQSKELLNLLRKLGILKPITVIIEGFYTEDPSYDTEALNAHFG